MQIIGVFRVQSFFVVRISKLYKAKKVGVENENKEKTWR